MYLIQGHKIRIPDELNTDAKIRSLRSVLGTKTPIFTEADGTNWLFWGTKNTWKRESRSWERGSKVAASYGNSFFFQNDTPWMNPIDECDQLGFSLGPYGYHLVVDYSLTPNNYIYSKEKYYAQLFSSVSVGISTKHQKCGNKKAAELIPDWGGPTTSWDLSKEVKPCKPEKLTLLHEDGATFIFDILHYHLTRIPSGNAVITLTDSIPSSLLRPSYRLIIWFHSQETVSLSMFQFLRSDPGSYWSHLPQDLITYYINPMVKYVPEKKK